MSNLDPLAVASNLTAAACECNAQQAALRARLMQAAEVIIDLHEEVQRLRRGDDQPAFLKRQAD